MGLANTIYTTNEDQAIILEPASIIATLGYRLGSLGEEQRKLWGILNNESKQASSRLLKCKDRTPFRGSKLYSGIEEKQGSSCR